MDWRNSSLQFQFEFGPVPLPNGTCFVPRNHAKQRWELWEPASYRVLGVHYTLLYQLSNDQFVCIEAQKSRAAGDELHDVKLYADEEALKFLMDDNFELPEQLLSKVPWACEPAPPEIEEPQNQTAASNEVKGEATSISPDGTVGPDFLWYGGKRYECELTSQQCDFLRLALAQNPVHISDLMNPNDGCLWKETYSPDKRNRISQLIARLNKSLGKAKPNLELWFRLKSDEDFIRRIDQRPG